MFFLRAFSKSINYKVPINPDAGPEEQRDREEEQQKIDEAQQLNMEEEAEKAELLTQARRILCSAVFFLQTAVCFIPVHFLCYRALQIGPSVISSSS